MTPPTARTWVRRGRTATRSPPSSSLDAAASLLLEKYDDVLDCPESACGGSSCQNVTGGRWRSPAAVGPGRVRRTRPGRSASGRPEIRVSRRQTGRAGRCARPHLHRRPARRTHWDDVVAKLGYGHLRRHDLRYTGLTWFADAGVQVHVLRRIASHGSLPTAQRDHVCRGGTLRVPRSLPSPSVVTRRPRSRVPAPIRSPKNDQGAVSEDLRNRPDLRLSRVGTTGFEPATP